MFEGSTNSSSMLQDQNQLPYKESSGFSKVSKFSNESQQDLWILFKIFELFPHARTNGSIEYILKGTIGGIEAINLKPTLANWYEIREQCQNSKAVEMYQKSETYKAYIDKIFVEMPWAFTILMVRPDGDVCKLRPSEILAGTDKACNFNAIKEMRRLIPGLYISKVDGLGDSEIERLKDIRTEFWSHVPLTNRTIVNNFLPDEPGAGAAPRKIREFEKIVVVETILTVKVRIESTTVAQLKGWHKNYNLNNGTTLSEEQFCKLNLSSVDKESMDKLYATKKKNHQASDAYYADYMHKAAEVMNRLVGAARDVVEKEMSEGLYHEAFVKFNKHMLTKSLNDPSSFQKKVKALVLSYGMSLISYERYLRDAVIEWATMLKIEDFQNKNDCDASELELDSKEMSANAGMLTDKEFRAEFHCEPMISHVTRVNIIIDGVKGSARFSQVMNTIAQLDPQKKTVREVSRLLLNVENSPEGQKILQEEVDNPQSKKKKVSIDDPKANVTSNPGKFTAGSCKYHPTSVTHNTEMCSTKGKSRGSAKQYNKSFDPCQYCLSIPARIGMATSHPNEKCFADPTSAGYRPPPRANVSSSDPAMLAFMTQQMTHQMEFNRSCMATFDKLNKKLSE